MIDGVKVTDSTSEATILSFKRLLSALGIITLSLIEVLFIYCFLRKENKMRTVKKVERRLFYFKSIMEGLTLEGQRRWIQRCIKEAKKDPSLSEAERSAYIDVVSNYYVNRMEVL